MGRKIPGKKHKGVKDPDKQRATRLSKIETRINSPPRNIDDQAVPKSLERLIKLKNAVKSGELKEKRKKKKRNNKLIRLGAEQIKTNCLVSKARPEKIVPVFNQEPGESQYQFWNRVNAETNAFVKETEFEVKYNVQVDRNAQTGQVEGISKRPKDEFDELKSKHSNIKSKKKTGDLKKDKLSKTQKRKEKLLQRKQDKINDKVDEFKLYEDKVQFGEVVHAPPSLTIPKVARKLDSKVKTSNLLLSSMLTAEKSSTGENFRKIDKKAKRKNLPLGERRQLEIQQSDAIAAYRSLKSKKM